MRSALTILTLAAASLCIAQQPAGAQYDGLVSPTGYTSSVGDSSTKCDGMCGGSGQCNAGLGCASCRQRSMLGRTFASLEYMHWWNKGRHLPPLVTTSPANTPQAQAGVLGFPNTQVLYGDDAIGGEMQPAGRLTFGFWLDDCHSVALGAKVFGVEGHNSGYFAQADGSSILTRPFFNDDPLVNAEDSLLVSYPGLSRGSVSAWAENEVFGTEAFLRYLIDEGLSYRLDLVTGYQFTRINDDLRLGSFIDDGVSTYDFLDVFKTSNEFHAGEIGLLGEWFSCGWTLTTLGKISYGNMHQKVDISGQNVVTAGGSVVTAGGLLAQPTNIGVFERDVNVWAPEANVRLGYAVTEKLSVSIGYSFLYWTRVALAGDQVDHHVNAMQLTGGSSVGPATPAFTGNDTDFWVQTVDIGMSWNF